MPRTLPEMDEPFNSSDIEFSPVRNKYAGAGSKSIASMCETLFDDRISSKKRLHHLTDTRGTLAAQQGHQLWLNRITNYAKENRILIDKQSGPDHVTIMRFIDTIVKHIKGRGGESSVPLRTGFKKSIARMFSALVFEYPKFKVDTHESARIDALIDQIADEGGLLRGRKRASLQWIGVSIVEKMSRSWMQAALDEGCLSWDIIIHKALTVVLQSALACRSGEITVSRGYEVEFMEWSHLRMKLPLSGSTINDIELTVDLKYEKGKKREKNDDRDVPLRALRDPSLNVVCPVKLLLIQALRSGNISSIDNALTHASLHNDRTIQWLHPKRPVIPSLHTTSGFILWDKLVHTSQVLSSIRALGLVGGVLANLVPHDLRRGAARDMANLKPTSNIPIGVATKEVAQMIGHSGGSYLQGTTDKYVGVFEQETYSARAEQSFVSRKAPAIGNPYKKIRLTTDEVNAFCEANNLAPNSSSARYTARTAIHSKRKADWIELETYGVSTLATASANTPASSVSKTRASVNTSAASLSTTPASANTPASSVSTTPASANTPASSVSKTRASVNTSAASLSTTPASANIPASSVSKTRASVNTSATSLITTPAIATTPTDIPIDPRLLALDTGYANTDNAVAERLISIIHSNNKPIDEEEEGIYLDMFLENIEQGKISSILTLPGLEFVEALSKINIVRCIRLQSSLRTLDKNIPLYCAIGNSRDYPTLWIYKCNKCTGYSNRSRATRDVHERVCLGDDEIASKKTEKAFICGRDGCEKAFSSHKALRHHEAEHCWIPIKCDAPGCTEDKVFATASSLGRHKMNYHRAIEPPVTCTFPGCKSVTIWRQFSNFEAHLRNQHLLLTATARKPYLPTTNAPSERCVSNFQPTKCPIPIEGSETCNPVLQKPDSLTRHLTRTHHLSLEEAQKITNEFRKCDRVEPDQEAQGLESGGEV